jgi:uncharacterized protein (DUF983 family)
MFDILEGIPFENILKADNNWAEFKKRFKHKLSDDIIHEVEKVLKCRTLKNGFITFICPNCGHLKHFPLSCKSKLCSRCGKKYTDMWSDKLIKRLLNTDHRHIVLTISDKLWRFFINRPALQKMLFLVANKTLLYVFSYHAKQKIIPGIMMIIHPFGDDLDPNFHVHILITCGGLTLDGSKWIHLPFISYDIIRTKWQYYLLTSIKELLPKRIIQPLADWCFKYRNNGFVIFANSVIKYANKGLLRYIARYTRHPAISKKRILSYNGKSVTFSYEAYDKVHTKTMDKFEFIYAVIQHMAPKNFKTIRYFGLYARRSHTKYSISKSLLPKTKSYLLQSFNYRSNITSFTGKDPLLCEHCKTEMVIYQITYINKHGTIKTVGGDHWVYYEPVELDTG